MECEHLSDHQEATAETLLSETPQKEPPVTKTACVILSLLNIECVDILHVCVVCLLHSSREESTPPVTSEEIIERNPRYLRF